MFRGPGPLPFDYESLLIKLGMLVGIIVVIYSALWILAELKVIPVILFAIFPQVVLLLIGIFIFYQAYNKYKR
ncbi:MAG: hypothetical protein MJ232_06690 [archaeon]|nr:hypothetical protein [archaeon]